ncbi:bacitracin ABC transporter ATP-binding protein [Neobacillus sp. SuZ13]|nr:bacitracin ABC transporter ATP-binding protein [Neobacillus sp. SuZ13]WHY64478.1 bacitracin ABC transporter ATP-binding protein [Neobacillus sp. SuZ13]
MFKDKNPFFSDEYLEELAKEINLQYGAPIKDQMTDPIENDLE